jgi:ribosomal protein L16 Arg81 hydroxylase
MGGGGVTAQTHYDSLHNLFAQLIGRKTFLLSPPRELDKLYLYSSLHPSYRQSQVDFVAPNVTQFPNFYNVSAIKVTLEPGDMLYLPPFWFHRVIAEDFSVSVSVWTDSEETVLYLDKIMVHSLPFDEGWAKADFQVGIKVFADILLKNIGGNSGTYVRY